MIHEMSLPEPLYARKCLWHSSGVSAHLRVEHFKPSTSSSCTAVASAARQWLTASRNRCACAGFLGSGRMVSRDWLRGRVAVDRVVVKDAMDDVEPADVASAPLDADSGSPLTSPLLRVPPTLPLVPNPLLPRLLLPGGRPGPRA
jgi:hypothetical protein